MGVDHYLENEPFDWFESLDVHMTTLSAEEWKKASGWQVSKRSRAFSQAPKRVGMAH